MGTALEVTRPEFPARAVDSGMSSPQNYDAFAITAPGLEPLAAAELQTLGASDARAVEGGVEFIASPRSLYTANLQLRTASRVVVRASEFGATAFYELERRAAKVPWDAFLAPNVGVSVRVTCKKSRLYHSDAVAERVAASIVSRVRGARIVDDAGDEESDAPSQLVIVRLFHDQCTVSIDSSGALLHRRGYRQAVGKAPMREKLAAETLLASGWRGQSPLVDPMCGAGTIHIEGALIARRLAPGLQRGFAFEQWPQFDAPVWAEVRAEAASAELPQSPVVIQGSDRDEGAIEAARANAARAGVEGDIEFAVRPISAATAPADRGWMVSNPPYGVRVGERDPLRNLYAQIGKVVRANFSGWRVALVTAEAGLERQLGLGLRPVLRTANGGIRVRVMAGEAQRSAEQASSGPAPRKRRRAARGAPGDG
jgi:putative N6-adenine-specific DNA methylase